MNSTTVTSWALVGLWVSSGLAAALWAARRGHFLPAWLVMGIVFGPLTWGLWRIDRIRDRDARPRPLAAGSRGVGPVDVLVGVDGSAESHAALRAVVELLGDRLGRLAVASVLDFDTALETQEWPERAKADGELASAVELMASLRSAQPETVLLTGRPAEALEQYADAECFTLVAIGSRGRGLTKALLGSTASDLSARSAVPVLIVNCSIPTGSSVIEP